VSIVIMVMVL